MDTLLFIHGWATDSFVWADAAGELGVGRNVINLNLPGHGGALKWDTPTLLPAVREVSARIAALPERSVTGVGWSLGAEVLLASFTELGDKFKALVLVGATPCFVSKEDFPAGQSRALVKRMILDMKKDPASTVERFYGLNFTASEFGIVGAKKLIGRYRYPGPVECAGPVPGCFPLFDYDGVTTALEALYEADLRAYLGRIDVPTLVVHGGKDGVTPAGAGEYLAERIKGARLEVFDEAGHAPFITEPRRFNETAGSFLKGL